MTRWMATCIVLVGFLASGCNRAPAPAGGELSFREQIDLAKQETDAELRAKRLIEIGVAQGKAQDRAGAESTLALAWKDCESLSDPAVRSGAFSALAEAGAAIDARGTARQAIGAALESAGKIEPPDVRAAAMARTAEAQGAAGDFAAASATLKSAEALLDKVEDLERKTAALCAVAKAFHSLDKTDDRDRALGAALHLAQSVGDARKRSKALAEVAVKQSALDESAARKTFEAALAAAAEIESPYTRVYALCDVAERYSEAGFPAKAHETLDLAEKAAEKVPQRDTQTQALLKVRALTDRLPKGP